MERLRHGMDWELAIGRNRDALMRMLAVLFALAGLTRGGAVAEMPRHLRVALYRVLRPAEAALRRLIVVVEQVHAIKARYLPRADGGVAVSRGSEGRKAAQAPAFALFDRRHYFDLIGKTRVTSGNPRIWSPGMDYPVFTPKFVPTPDDMVSAERLCRRLQALQRALDDLPKQAKRLARWRAKREQAPTETRKYPPMRPGRPPGYRVRPVHEVHHVLKNCHELALYALHDPPDTS